mgnify:CR=1 FL=1
MAKPTSDTETIESLLEQRAQFEQWLAKLDGAANNAPAAVRQKVRGDYEARLRGVIERLRGHAATISTELQRHQSAQAELDQHRRQAEEELAEAIFFLCSERASYITGQVLAVDGGFDSTGIGLPTLRAQGKNG